MSGTYQVVKWNIILNEDSLELHKSTDCAKAFNGQDLQISLVTASLLSSRRFRQLPMVEKVSGYHLLLD